MYAGTIGYPIVCVFGREPMQRKQLFTHLTYIGDMNGVPPAAVDI